MLLITNLNTINKSVEYQNKKNLGQLAIINNIIDEHTTRSIIQNKNTYFFNAQLKKYKHYPYNDSKFWPLNYLINSKFENYDTLEEINIKSQTQYLGPINREQRSAFKLKTKSKACGIITIDQNNIIKGVALNQLTLSNGQQVFKGYIQKQQQNLKSFLIPQAGIKPCI